LVDITQQESHRTGSRSVDRCSSVAVGEIQSSAATDQKVDDTSMVSFDSVVDSRFPGVVSTIQRRASVRQEPNDVEVTVLSGEMEWRVASTVQGVDLRPRNEERAYDVDVSPSGSEVEWRSAARVSHIGSSSLLEHILHNAEMTEIGSSMQWEHPCGRRFWRAQDRCPVSGDRFANSIHATGSNGRRERRHGVYCRERFFYAGDVGQIRVLLRTINYTNMTQK